jgi:hypothetical protein
MRRTVNVAAAVLAIFGVASSVGADVTPKLTRTAYESAAGSKGVVLLAVRWDRWWGCGGYDNAQLTLIGFDRLPSAKLEQDLPDILLVASPYSGATTPRTAKALPDTWPSSRPSFRSWTPPKRCIGCSTPSHLVTTISCHESAF